jgi:hypothetical protein
LPELPGKEKVEASGGSAGEVDKEKMDPTESSWRLGGGDEFFFGSEKDSSILSEFG